MATVDTSELDKLVVDLGEIPEQKLPQVKKVVSKGALNIKNGMRTDAANGHSYRHFARSIDYDIDDGGLGAEIGPNKDQIQGALGNILYFGTSKNAPVLDINGPLHTEEPRFADAIADVAADIL
jgi:hypothetical protein